MLFYLFPFSFCYQSASDGFWKSVATRVPREPHEIRILNPYFIQEAAFSFIGLPFNNGLMGRGVGIKQNKQNQGEGWETKQQSRLTLFLLFLWASTVGHWREVTLVLLWWQRAASLRPRQGPSFLVRSNGCYREPLFWRQLWGFQHQLGDFLSPAACQKGTCLCVWRELLPKRKKEPCSLHPQCIWKQCRSS